MLGMKTKEDGKKYNYLGKAGEHRIMAELLMRGINPCRAEIDDGMDFILENGKKIQAKASHSVKMKIWRYEAPTYRYDLGKRRYHALTGKTLQTFPKEDIDFYILWMVNDDKFLVIPKTEIGKIKSIVIPDLSGKSKWHKFLDKWDLLI